MKSPVQELIGFGLHSGCAARVRVRAHDGPTTLGCGAECAPIGELGFRGAERACVATLPGGTTIRTVEHLLAAVAGLGAFWGLSIDVEGEELPLLDGGAQAYCAVIDALLPQPRSVTPALVVRESEFAFEGAKYRFAKSSARHVEVDVDFEAERFGVDLRGRAAWAGDAASFRKVIAPSRTFGAARELVALRAQGLAAHIPAGSVVGLDVEDARYKARDPEEPIRHKLLDLIGDLGTLGFPVLGHVFAYKPSHRATRAILVEALRQNVFALPTQLRSL